MQKEGLGAVSRGPKVQTSFGEAALAYTAIHAVCAIRICGYYSHMAKVLGKILLWSPVMDARTMRRLGVNQPKPFVQTSSSRKTQLLFSRREKCGVMFDPYSLVGTFTPRVI